MLRSVPYKFLCLLVLCLAALVSPEIAGAAPRHAAAHGKARQPARSSVGRTHGAMAKANSPGKSSAHRTRGQGRDTGKAARLTGRASQPGLRSGLRSGPGSRLRSGPAYRSANHGRLSRREAKHRWRQEEEEAALPAASPAPAPNSASLRRVRLSMPPPLRGSYESLVHQNEMADAEGLERILDDEDLQSRIAQKSLVPVPVSASLQINPELPENRRYCRPWTARFLADLAQDHASHFPGAALLVTSAVRTVEYQRHLQRVNGNAAAAEGDVASPHLTGGTVDIAKKGLGRSEIAWLRDWLLPLEAAGKIDVEEEFKQSCFHISVYKTYSKDQSSPQSKTPGQGAPLAASAGTPAQGR